MELLWSGDLDWVRQVRQDWQHQSTYNYTCVSKLRVLRTGRFKEAERDVGVLIRVEASILLNANTPAGSWHRGLCLRPVMAETMKSHFHNRAEWAVWLQQTPNGDVLWRWIMYITIASTSQIFAFFRPPEPKCTCIPALIAEELKLYEGQGQNVLPSSFAVSSQASKVWHSKTKC